MSKKIFVTFLLYFLVNSAWLDWPLTRLTNHCVRAVALLIESAVP